MIFELTFGTALLIVLISFILEYFDASFGMGYGTLLTPVLLIMGFEPLVVVPSALLAQLVTGLLAGFSHHNMGNVDFKPKSTNIARIIMKLRELGVVESARIGLPRALKIAIILSICSIIGSFVAVFLSVSISEHLLKIYIGAVITIIGLFILITRTKTFKFSKIKIVILGMIASFNKGLSGGGYGPVVVGGQVVSGVDPKNAIGITSLSEGITCIAAVLLYFLINKGAGWQLAPYLLTGSALSVPFSVMTVKKMKPVGLRLAMGMIITVLGLVTLYSVI